jgi:hypothetical protein
VKTAVELKSDEVVSQSMLAAVDGGSEESGINEPPAEDEDDDAEASVPARADKVAATSIGSSDEAAEAAADEAAG